MTAAGSVARTSSSPPGTTSRIALRARSTGKGQVRPVASSWTASAIASRRTPPVAQAGRAEQQPADDEGGAAERNQDAGVAEAGRQQIEPTAEQQAAEQEGPARPFDEAPAAGPHGERDADQSERMQELEMRARLDQAVRPGGDVMGAQRARADPDRA